MLMFNAEYSTSKTVLHFKDIEIYWLYLVCLLFRRKIFSDTLQNTHQTQAFLVNAKHYSFVYKKLLFLVLEGNCGALLVTMDGYIIWNSLFQATSGLLNLSDTLERKAKCVGTSLRTMQGQPGRKGHQAAGSSLGSPVGPAAYFSHAFSSGKGRGNTEVATCV